MSKRKLTPTPDRCLSRPSAHPPQRVFTGARKQLFAPKRAMLGSLRRQRASPWEILFANTTASISGAEFVADQPTHVVKLNN